LSLLVQLIAIPYHQARAAPGFVSDPIQVAADLKTIFGDAAALCVQVDDKSAPVAPAGHCDDQCPLFRFASQASALVAPVPAALPEPRLAVRQDLGMARETNIVPARGNTQNRARAPPLAV
jgi:hypothetical protein